MPHRPVSFWKNLGCSCHCSLVVKSEILHILVHIVWEPARSIVVIVSSLKITIQSLQDLAHISFHSTQIVVVLDLLIDCVHCDPVSFCLRGTLLSMFLLKSSCSSGYGLQFDCLSCFGPCLWIHLCISLGSISPHKTDLWILYLVACYCEYLNVDLDILFWGRNKRTRWSVLSVWILCWRGVSVLPWQASLIFPRWGRSHSYMLLHQ